MSIATGIAPGQLPLRDGAMWDELLEQLEHRWTRSDELLAELVELTHAHLLAFLRVNSKKGARLPAPLQVPRPAPVDQPAAPAAAAQRVSIAELAALHGSSAELVDTSAELELELELEGDHGR